MSLKNKNRQGLAFSVKKIAICLQTKEGSKGERVSKATCIVR